MPDALVAPAPVAFKPRLRPEGQKVLVICGRPEEIFNIKKQEFVLHEDGTHSKVVKSKAEPIQAQKHLLYVDERDMNTKYAKVKDFNDGLEYDEPKQTGIRDLEGYGPSGYFMEVIRTTNTPKDVLTLDELMEKNDKRFDAFVELCIKRGKANSPRNPVTFGYIASIIRAEQKRYAEYLKKVNPK